MILLSSVSMSVTGPTALSDNISPVTAMVVVYSLVEPSELVANTVISTPVPLERSVLSNTVTTPVTLSIANAPLPSLLKA